MKLGEASLTVESWWWPLMAVGGGAPLIAVVGIIAQHQLNLNAYFSGKPNSTALGGSSENIVWSFILIELAELAARYSVPMPKFAILEDVIERTGNISFYNVDEKTIVFDRVLVSFWEVDKERAEIVLRWLIAHEFYHYLLDYRRLKRLEKAVEERSASNFARRETGITWETAKKAFREIERKLGRTITDYRLLRTRLEEPRRYTVSTPTHSSQKKIIKWKKPFCPVGVECKIVEMSPLEYLSKVPSPCREGRTAAEDIDLKGCWSESSIKYITEKVKRGEEIEPPFINYSRMFRGFPTHEGRHRAFVAYKMDIEKIPVVIFS